MGNEQTAPLQQEDGKGGPQNIQMVQPKEENPQQAPQRQYTHGILIAIRGQRCTGKTTLVNRMKGGRFVEDYNPTKYLQATEIPYQPEELSTDILSVKVMDVVEKALVPEDIIEDSAYPDASTVDTYKRSDGIVILIDSRHKDTIDVAAKILKEAPKEIPIIVFSNFQDVDGVRAVLPDALKPYLGRFTYIPGSLKSNLGLIELSKWLMIPYMFSKKRQYLDLYNKMSQDLEAALAETYAYASNFVTLASAKEHMPVPPVRPQPATQRREGAKGGQLTRTNSDEQFVKYRLKQQQQIKQMEKEQRRKERRASRQPNINDDFFEDVDTSSESDDEFAVSARDDYYGNNSPNPLVQNVPVKSKSSPRSSPLSSPKVKQSNLVPKEEQQEEELARRDGYEVDTSNDTQQSSLEDNYPKNLKPTLFDSPLTLKANEEEEEQAPQRRAKQSSKIKKQYRQSQNIEAPPKISKDDYDDFFASDDDVDNDVPIKQLPPILGLEPRSPALQSPKPTQSPKSTPKLTQSSSSPNLTAQRQQNSPQKDLPRRKTRKLRRH